MCIISVLFTSLNQVRKNMDSVCGKKTTTVTGHILSVSLCFKKMTLLNLQWICAFQIMSKPTPKCHWLANISTVFFVSTTAQLYEFIFSANGCLYEHQTWSVPSVSSILICTDSRRLSHILSGKRECFTKVSGRQMHRCSEPKPPASAQHCCVLIRAEVKGTDKERMSLNE